MEEKLFPEQIGKSLSEKVPEEGKKVEIIESSKTDPQTQDRSDEVPQKSQQAQNFNNSAGLAQSFSSLNQSPIKAPNADSPVLFNDKLSMNGRYSKTDDLISKSQYRQIYLGYDNDSGCEIAWCVYPLKQLSDQQLIQTQKILEDIKGLEHQYILKCRHYKIVQDPSDQSLDEEQKPQLILITELITAGSIREYLKKIRVPRLIVIKNWCYKILKGLEFLHQQGQNRIHGKLNCESIYINSNNGEIKIGDLGIRHMPLYNQRTSEIHHSKILQQEHDNMTLSYDIYCFGLCLLEMISSDIQVPHAFKYLCKLINLGFKKDILNMIEDSQLSDILRITLNEVPSERWNATQLMNHNFFVEQPTDRKAVSIQIKKELTVMVQKLYDRQHHHSNNQSQRNSRISGDVENHPSFSRTSQSSPFSTSNGKQWVAQNDSSIKKFCIDQSYVSNQSLLEQQNNQSSKSQVFKIQPIETKDQAATKTQIKKPFEVQVDKTVLDSAQSLVFQQVQLEDESIQQSSVKESRQSPQSQNPPIKPVNTKRIKTENTQQRKPKKKQKYLNFYIKFEIGKKTYEIDFKYDVELDNPQKIVVELKDQFKMLPQSKLDAIKREIENSLINLQKKKRAEEEKKNQKNDTKSEDEKKIVDEKAIMQRRQQMRQKSNNMSNITKKLNMEGSSLMEPIEEKRGEIDRSKSITEVHNGMIIPNIAQMNKTVNYEIYHGNSQDKFDCPQNINLVNKKELVYSVQYPHGALNFSVNSSQKKQKKNNNLTLKEKAVTSLNHIKSKYEEVTDQAQVSWWNTRDFIENENDRDELLHIIEKIPDIDISQFPGENFLHQNIQEYQTYQLQYHQKMEQDIANRSRINETLLEFDYHQDLLHFLQEPTTHVNQSVCFPDLDVSVILPSPMQNILSNGQQPSVKVNDQSVSNTNPSCVTQFLCDQIILDHLGQQIFNVSKTNLSKINLSSAHNTVSIGAVKKINSKNAKEEHNGPELEEQNKDFNPEVYEGGDPVAQKVKTGIDKIIANAKTEQSRQSNFISKVGQKINGILQQNTSLSTVGAQLCGQVNISQNLNFSNEFKEKAFQKYSQSSNRKLQVHKSMINQNQSASSQYAYNLNNQAQGGQISQTSIPQNSQQSFGNNNQANQAQATIDCSQTSGGTPTRVPTTTLPLMGGGTGGTYINPLINSSTSHNSGNLSSLIPQQTNSTNSGVRGKNKQEHEQIPDNIQIL